MADKTIGELPRAESLDSESLLVAEQQGEAVSVTGELIANFARDAAAADVQKAVDAAASAETAADRAESAKDSITIDEEKLAQAVSSASTSASEASASASEAEEWSKKAEAIAGGGVLTFNGRSGYVLPASGDYTYDMVGAAPAPLSAQKTLYVATTGSDTTGDGSSTNPYATIQYALDTLPKDLGEYKVTINVAAGEYAGFEVKSFSGGYSNNPGITIKGESRDSVTITGNADVESCSSMVALVNLHFTNRVRSLANRYYRISGCLIDGTAAVEGIWLCDTNTAAIFNTIINDKTNYAILVDGSTAFVSYVSGVNNTKGLQSGSSSSALPGLAVVGNFTLSADTQYVKERGGVIIVGNAFV